MFRGTRAYEDFLDNWKGAGRGPREEVGDRLGLEKLPRKKALPPELYPALGALFQGDHLGVEYALGGHEGLLHEGNLLPERERLVGKEPVGMGPIWRGLIIDDFFVISSQADGCRAEDSPAFHILQEARELYQQHDLPGSPEKDVAAERLFQAAGAEIDSREEVTTKGLTLVAAPLAKRIGLATVSLRVASLKNVTPDLMARLAGGWVSALLYRRCLSSIVDEMFSLANFRDQAEAASLEPLSPKVRSEMCLLSVLSPMMSSNVMVDYGQQLFATDASTQKGAIVATDISEEEAKVLWQGGDRKGSYTMLDNPFKEVLADLGIENDENEDWKELQMEPERERPFFFDFVEVFGGVGAVSKALVSLNMVVAPVLDITWSKKYDISPVKMLEWLYDMLRSGRILAVLLAPPCTTFSAAAYPCLRTYVFPRGLNRKHPRVIRGNQMAFRALLVMKYALSLGLPCMLEQPRLSKMAWLSAWAWLRRLGCEEAVVAACGFGSPHRKEFRLLCGGLNVEEIDSRCTKDHTHVPIAGKYTAPSAVYTPQMAMHLAKAFKKGILQRKRDLFEERRTGEESLLVNDLLLTKRWSEVASWEWKRRPHINVLETGTVETLLEDLTKSGGSRRDNILVDSLVAKGALAKGRSSAFSLSRVLKRSASYQIAGDLYPALSFAPTRWNPSDAPTRDKAMPIPVPHSLSSVLDFSLLRESHSIRLSRHQSNWVRLSLLVFLLQPTSALPDVASHYQSCGFCNLGWVCFLFCVHYLIPCVVLILPPTVFLCLGSRSIGKCRWPLVALTLAVRPLGVVAPMAPGSTVEHARAAMRSGIVLASDRLVRKQTRENRYQLLLAFEKWLLEEHGLPWDAIFEKKPLDGEEVSNWLSLYGKDLHASGKTYGKYAGTINAVAMSRPILKRQLGGAWDVAFAWLMDEPYGHHPALPATLLVAVVTVALIWGWPREAALFCLGWSGLLRAGELVGLKRSDLVLPCDADPGMKHILVQLHEAKSRGRMAKHQSAKVEQQDLVALISAVFKNFDGHQKLWELSAATLRRRLMQLLSSLGIPAGSSAGIRGYDLSSLRPGGATNLLALTESSELVRRRGRWASTKVMDIYLQEISVATGLVKLKPETRLKVEKLCAIFEAVVDQSIYYMHCSIPCTAWSALFRHQNRQGSTGG